MCRLYQPNYLCRLPHLHLVDLLDLLDLLALLRQYLPLAPELYYLNRQFQILLEFLVHLQHLESPVVLE